MRRGRTLPSAAPISSTKTPLSTSWKPFAISKPPSLSPFPKRRTAARSAYYLPPTIPRREKRRLPSILALMFAISNVKVVLIDADIRKGRISKYFKEQPVPGLSDYLSGRPPLRRFSAPPKKTKTFTSFIRELLPPALTNSSKAAP